MMSTPTRRKHRRRVVTDIHLSDQQKKKKDQAAVRRQQKKLENEARENHIVFLEEKCARLERRIKALLAEIEEKEKSAVTSASDDGASVEAASVDSKSCESLPPRSASAACAAVESDSDCSFSASQTATVNVDRVTQLFEDVVTNENVRDRQCRFLTGMPPKMLLNYMSVTVEHVTKVTMRGEERKRQRESKLEPRLKIFVAMIRMRMYLPYWFMAMFLGFPERYVQKVVKQAMTGLENFHSSLPRSKGGFCAPLDDKFVKELKEKQDPLRNVEQGLTGDVCLDGMHLPVSSVTVRKTDTAQEKAEKEAWRTAIHNAKHAMSAGTILLLVDLYGRILKVWGPVYMQENSYLKKLKLFDTLAAPFDLAIYADAGLHVASAPVARQQNFKHGLLKFSVGPTSISICRKVLKHKEHFSSSLYEMCSKILATSKAYSKFRIVVENTIGRARMWK